MPKKHRNNPRSKRGKSHQKSSLDGPSAMTKVWNINAQQMPEFNNTLKKDNLVHRFIQMTDYGSVLTSSTTVTAGYARAWMFTDVVQQTTFSALFDQYRVDEVEVWLTPTVASGLSFVTGDYDSCIDYDDDTVTTIRSNIQQRTNCVTTPLTNGHYWKWKPHVAEALYGGGAFTSYGNISAPWIDVASPSVKHYGIKFVFGVTSSVVVMYLQMRMHFSCRNVF